MCVGHPQFSFEVLGISLALRDAVSSHNLSLSPDELSDEHLPEVGLVLSVGGVLQGDHGPGHRGQAREDAGDGVGVRHAHQPRAPGLRRQEGEGVRQAARGVREPSRGRPRGRRG